MLLAARSQLQQSIEVAQAAAGAAEELHTELAQCAAMRENDMATVRMALGALREQIAKLDAIHAAVRDHKLPVKAAPTQLRLGTAGSRAGPRHSRSPA